MSKPTIDIVIPSYNARDLLKKNLPKILKYSPEINQTIIVDDGSTDGTQKFLKEHFPKIKVVRNEKNLGFPKGVNRGFSASQADFVVLINNDVYPTNSYIQSALKYFEDDEVFAVTFNEKHSAPPDVAWKKGKLQFTRTKDKTKPRYSAWASGGSAIFSRSLWNKLGGLDEVYSPGYWEDIDLGWRAWKLGYKIIFDPQAKVVHDHESSFKKLDKNYLNLIKQRNELLFAWLNISDLSLSLSHAWSIIFYSSFHPGYFKVIFKALLRLPSVNKSLHSFKGAKRTDKEVLALVNKTL